MTERRSNVPAGSPPPPPVSQAAPPLPPPPPPVADPVSYLAGYRDGQRSPFTTANIIRGLSVDQLLDALKALGDVRHAPDESKNMHARLTEELRNRD